MSSITKSFPCVSKEPSVQVVAAISLLLSIGAPRMETLFGLTPILSEFYTSILIRIQRTK
jgi:hypothetical protein